MKASLAILAVLGIIAPQFSNAEEPSTVIYVREFNPPSQVENYSKLYGFFTNFFKEKNGEKCPAKAERIRAIFESAIRDYPRPDFFAEFPVHLAVSCSDDLRVTNSHQGIVFVGSKDSEKYSDSFLKFVMLHEIAHIALLHLDRAYRGLPSLTEAESKSELPYLQQEEEADAAAFCLSDSTGKMRDRISIEFSHFWANAEIVNRFDQLQQRERPAALKRVLCP